MDIYGGHFYDTFYSHNVPPSATKAFDMFLSNIDEGSSKIPKLILYKAIMKAKQGSSRYWGKFFEAS